MAITHIYVRLHTGRFNDDYDARKKEEAGLMNFIIQYNRH